MDAATILELKPALTTFLHAFDGCFGRRTTRRYLDLYVAGQLSDMDRKSVEPMADAADVPPRWQVPHPPACAVRALRQHWPVGRRIPWPTYRVPAGGAPDGRPQGARRNWP